MFGRRGARMLAQVVRAVSGERVAAVQCGSRRGWSSAAGAGSMGVSAHPGRMLRASALPRVAASAPCAVTKRHYAVPKHKVSVMKRKIRRAGHGKIAHKENISDCYHCGKSRLMHRICHHCGYPPKPFSEWEKREAYMAEDMMAVPASTLPN